MELVPPKRVIAVLTAIAAVLIVAVLAFAGSTGAASRQETSTIASATAGGFRAVVTATKTSAGSAPSASVDVTAYERAGSSWREVGRVRAGRPSGFFWKVLTGPRSLREFSIATTAPEHVSLQVLVTPALGWSPVYRFHVDHGRLVAGER